MPAPYTPVTHVIFDMDGLLLDTEGLYGQAFEAVVKQHGNGIVGDHRTYDYNFVQQMLGKSSAEICVMGVNHFKLPITPQLFGEQMMEQLQTLFQRVNLMPGAERLVRHFAAQKVLMSVCTGSSGDEVKMKIVNYQDLFDLFHEIVPYPDRKEVKRSKPHPDPFLYTASRFPGDVKPSKILVFEDAENGVQAARAAGMQTVFVPSPRYQGPELQRATLALSSLNDFKPELFSLPPF